MEDPRDAIVRVSSAAICGSDLHFYTGKARLSPGDGIGHEGMGVVEAVGPDVRGLEPGDRVVISFDVVCDDCWFCRRLYSSLCPAFRNFGACGSGVDVRVQQAEAVT